MTYLGHLVSLWMPPLANSRRWLDARLPIRRCDLKDQDYPGLPRTTLRYDLFDTPYLQYLVFVAGPRMFTRSLMASGAGASTLN